MSPVSGVVTLLTDFGHKDPYVGVMKGVILGICPTARLVDLTHEVSPQDVVEGALQLARAVDWFPEGTIHVAVVDPDVGSDRQPLVIVGEKHYYVGPDNGMFALALERDTVRDIRRIERYTLPVLSATFHGRDVFAPVAGHLARGVKPADLGPPANPLRKLKLRMTKGEGANLEAAVMLIDHFGNIITGAHFDQLGFQPKTVEVKGKKVPVKEAYSQVESGKPVAVRGSDGFLEISVNQGNAARHFGVQRGDRVRVL